MKLNTESQELVNSCRVEIDSGSSIPFDPATEDKLAELVKVMALGIVNALMEQAKSPTPIPYLELAYIKKCIENNDCKQ